MLQKYLHIFQVTEKTAIILDECGILTTYRGETFVKGAGYIKTYFVPLDENFNLIKKENSINFYRIEDRTRYYNARNSILEDNISLTTSEKSHSTYSDFYAPYSDDDVRKLDDMDMMNRSAVVTDEDSYISSEPEIRETRC